MLLIDLQHSWSAEPIRTNPRALTTPKYSIFGSQRINIHNLIFLSLNGAKRILCTRKSNVGVVVVNK